MLRVVRDVDHEVFSRAAAVFTGYVQAPRLWTDDVRDWLCDELRAMNRVLLRDGGGFWYVPGAHSARLRSLRDLVASLPSSGAPAEVSLLSRYRTEATVGYLREQAEADIMGRVRSLKEDVDGWSAPDSSFRKDTLERRLERIMELRTEGTMWRELLQLQTGELDRRLDDLRAHLHALIGVA